MTVDGPDVPGRERLFGEGHKLRTNFVQPYGCKNVLIEGVTFVNSPMWELNPVLCENVTIRGVKKPGAVTITSAIRGGFRKDPRTRAEARARARG